MTARDLFSVALRVLGVWFLYNAADSAIWWLFRKIGVAQTPAFPLPTENKIAEHEFFILFYLALAIIALCYGDRIASVFYGSPKTIAKSDAAQRPSNFE